MNSIEQDIKKNLGESKLPKDVALRLKRKMKNLKLMYGINFDNTIFSMEKNPLLYKQRDEIPGLSDFFRRDIDICIKRLGSNDIVYSKFHKSWVKAVQAPYRIAIDNPFTEKVESWSRISSISKSRTIHHSTSKNKNKSKFLGGVNYIQPLEISAFNNGIGLLLNTKLLRMYAGYDKDIGKSKDGKLQKYICVECERISRREDTNAVNTDKVFGYKLRIHGYPMSADDLAADFKDTPLKIDMLPMLSG